MASEVQRWINAADVESDARALNIELPAGVSWEDVCQAATSFLFYRSAERFPGVRTDTIRPTRLGAQCGCDNSWWLGMSTTGPGFVGRTGTPVNLGCGCPSPYEYTLPGGPVQAIEQVMVDGVPLQPNADYTLYPDRLLVRNYSPVMGAIPWPCCQILAYPATMVGTWSITYTHGMLPDTMGLLACREMTIQLALLIANRDSRLAPNVRTVSRGGVSIDLSSSGDVKKYGTGIRLVDLWLASVNPDGVRRRAHIYSPDTLDGIRA